MILNGFDWIFVGGFFLVSLVVGILVMKRAGSSAEEFFTGGKRMPWWLLGISMVATTFSTDTPNLVTDIVRNHGVSGNWVWFAFLITGMVTVFIYARLWKRSNVMTDIEFYEIRYSGKAASFLRGFRALYLGLFFNIIIMAAVSLAAIKISGILLGISPGTTILIAGSVVVVYSMLGGLQGILITDCLQFIIAMAGSIFVAVVAVKDKVGGLSELLSHPNVVDKISILPDFTDAETALGIFIIPLAVQWWSVWYPGSEPGGGGYIAQRMFAAKNEKHSLGATFLFNVAHYGLRPWPWILVALASLVVFPNLESLQQAFPHLPPDKIGHDMAYPAMISFLPHGILGLVVASLFAAYMSTISTHLNWGSSYIVNDFYRRFIHPEADDKELVKVGRVSTLVLMILAGTFALVLSHALQAFNILLQIGAGTGLLFLLRWFWWRINAVSELAAMIISFGVAVYFEFFHELIGFSPFSTWKKLSLGVLITTIGWISATFFSKPTDKATLIKFYKLIRPGGPGWRGFAERIAPSLQDDYSFRHWNLPRNLLSVFFGCVAVYGTIFATGYWIYSQSYLALAATGVTVIATIGLLYNWKKTRN